MPKSPATPTTNETADNDWLRSFSFSAMGVGLFLSADLFCTPWVMALGPRVLFGLMVPANLLSCGLLSYAVSVERNNWWRIVLSLCLSANLISIAFVGLITIGYYLFKDFPGPG